MAGFLSLLPGLFSTFAGKDSAGKAGEAIGHIANSGVFDTIKNAIGGVLADVGSGNVNSGADFGRALARSGAKALGVEIPKTDHNTSSGMDSTKMMLDHGGNANNETTMIKPANQPKSETYNSHIYKGGVNKGRDLDPIEDYPSYGERFQKVQKLKPSTNRSKKSKKKVGRKSKSLYK